MTKKAVIKCATCGKDSVFFDSPVGPFCSSRCKMVDLGKWFDEEYVITGPLRPEDFEEYEGLVGGAELDQPDPSDY